MKNAVQAFALICIALIIAGCGGFKYTVSHYPTYMCSEANVTVEAKINEKVDRIKVYDDLGILWGNRKNAKRISVYVPNLQRDQLQFRINVKEGDVRKWEFTDIALYDNPKWVDGDGIRPTQIDMGTEVISEDHVAHGPGAKVCMEWDDEGECSEEQTFHASNTCYSVHEVYFTYGGATWTFAEGIDYSNRIKANAVKNDTSRVVTVRPGAGPASAVNPGNTVSFAPISPGAVEVTLQIPVDERERKLCAKTTEMRNCSDSGTFNKEYMPDFEDCIGSPPVIDMRLFCEQP